MDCVIAIFMQFVNKSVNFFVPTTTEKNHKKKTKQKSGKKAAVATSWDMWHHYSKVVMFTVSFINPDYLMPNPEFDILDFRQYNKLFTMGGFWKKVICVLYIVIIWPKQLV